MADVVVNCEWSEDDAEAVVDMLPESPEQACHLLMMLACTFGLELGMAKDNFLEEMAKCFDVVVCAENGGSVQ